MLRLTLTDPDVLSSIAGKAIRWVSLTPGVVAVSDIGDVNLTGVGEASVFAIALAKPGNRQEANRVVMRVTFEVLRRPLRIVDSWVDTIKELDNDPGADAVAGALQGVLPQDEAHVGATISAAYDGIGYLSVGAGKRIVARYALTGSRAYCYLPPKNDTLIGAIVAPGSHAGDVWGIVLRQEEAGGPARPYADVSLACAVGGASADTVLTDAYGRYFVSGLARGDKVVLRPEAKRTWIVSPPQQTFTVTGSVDQQAAPFVYAPDSLSLVLLTLRDDSGDTLICREREEIGDTTYYELPCNRGVATLNVSYVAPPGVTGNLVPDEAEAAGEASGAYRSESVATQQSDSLISVDVSKPGRRIFTLSLSSGKRYTVVIDRPYGLFDVVIEHLGNIRVVNNNPAINGGFEFESCEWWYRKLGKEEWQLAASGGNLYYAAGPSIADKFNPEDSMRVVLHTVQGGVLATCPDADAISAGGAGGANGGNSSRRSDEDVDHYAYPNPVRGGGKIYLKQSIILTGEGEERYTTYRLFTSVGRLVLSGSASVLIEGLTMPETSGAYYLILDGKAGRRAIHIAVVN